MKPHISKDRLAAFLYLLMRDMVTSGRLEKILEDIGKQPSYVFTNGYLARYAEDMAKRLR